MKRNQFVNAFVRQLGREAAHSTYKEITSYGNGVKSIESKPTIVLGWFRLVLDFIIGLFIPFVAIIPLVRGIKRLSSDKLKGQVLATLANYKTDMRCRYGARYLGDTKEWIDVELPRNEFDETELEKNKVYGIIEIVFFVCFTIFYIWFAVNYLA